MNTLNNLYLYLSLSYMTIFFVAPRIEASTQSIGVDNESLELRAYCNLATSSALNQFKWIIENWITRKDSPWHIESNFKRLNLENNNRYKQILTVAEIGHVSIDNIESLKEKIRELSIYEAKGSIVFTDVRVANDYFEMSLFALEGAMSDLYIEITTLQQSCKTFNTKLQILTQHLDQYKKVINTYRTYVYQSTIKTENLFLIAIELAKAELYKSYISKTNEQLEEVKRQIHDTLALDLLYTEFLIWWQNTSVRTGIGDGLHQKYLMYVSPLMIMQEQLTKAKSFYARVSNEAESNSAKTRILNEVKHAVSLIEGEIAKLELLGWEGQRDRQIDLNQHRAQNSPSASCLNAISYHKTKADAAKSASDFKQVSEVYLTAVAVCERGSNQ